MDGQKKFRGAPSAGKQLQRRSDRKSTDERDSAGQRVDVTLIIFTEGIRLPMVWGGHKDKCDGPPQDSWRVKRIMTLYP